MVMADKHFTHASVSLDKRDWEIIGKLSARTRVSKAHFVREALRSVIIKYKALVADDSTLDLSEYEAAPAHAELLRQKRDPSKAIQPHEGVPSVVAAAEANQAE